MLNPIALQLDREEIKGREDGERGDCSREAIILSVSVKGGGYSNYSREAINQGTATFVLFEEIRYV